MAKQPPVRVALDLETTGLHAEQDTILEVAAIKFQGSTIIDTMETLVDPGRPVPYRVQRLTGITPQHLIGAPRFETIAKKLQYFIGDLPIVGHSIPFDVGFLRRRGLVHSNPLIDTFELATIFLPSLTGYDLGRVAEALNAPVTPGRHRAMVDTVLAMKVFLALYERLQAIDLALLQDLASLDAPRNWPLLAFFRQELRERQQQDGLHGPLMRGSLGDRFAAQLGMDPRILSFGLARPELFSGEGRKFEQEEKIVDEPVEPQNPSEFQPAPASVGQLTPLALNYSDQLQTLVEVIPEQTVGAGAELSDGITFEGTGAVARPAPMGYQTARTAVRETLEQCTQLLMEVTLAGNDYTPALLPTLEWFAESSPDMDGSPPRLVIACSTQHHARRLLETILPRLQMSLKSQLSVAYLAEHGGYLCIHRWFGAALRRTSGELTAEQARGLAKLGLWAQQTSTGERSELTMLPHEITAWQRISSGVEHNPSAADRSGSAYKRCNYRRKGYCFVSRAEERIHSSTIVVTTHAGLLDDLSSSHSLLASVKRRLILDADLFEDEIARWSSIEFAQTRLISLLNTIGTELPDSRYQGLLALAAPALRENGPGGLSTTPTIGKSEVDTQMRSWFQTLRQACTAVDTMFSSFSLLLEEFLQQGTSAGGRDIVLLSGEGRKSGQGEKKGRSDKTSSFYGGRNNERTDQPLRLTGQTRNLSSWMNVERAWLQTSQRLQAVIDLAHEAERMIVTTQRNRHRLDQGSGEDDSVASELGAVAQRLLEQKKLVEQALALDDSEMVYWLRMPPSSQPTVHNLGHQRQDTPPASTALPAESCPILYAQLVQTPALVRRLLLQTGACNIFTGVALSVDNSFTSFRSRFGLDIVFGQGEKNDVCPALSVVTEHHEQTLLYLPNDIPEPNTAQYQRHLEEALVQLATTLEGQLVVLFTSHASLRSSYASIKPVLEARGILVLGQGIDGSPRQLWHLFSSQERIVVLGAGAFWDSIGENNHVPACLVIARLPMPVLNDPPVAARAEQYSSDQLHQFTVPLAALRVRRALNRLVWNDTRRNVVVLFDRRVLSKDYGSTVLHTLPHCSQRQGAVSHMPETILDWLTASGSWE